MVNTGARCFIVSTYIITTWLTQELDASLYQPMRPKKTKGLWGGLRKPVNFLRRGCTVDDIVNTAVITAIQAHLVRGEGRGKAVRSSHTKEDLEGRGPR
eukprot:1177986-Prorocentrum_minimum.AAC.2